MFSNKILSEKLYVPLTKIRRWSKEFLPPDPKATQRSGYSRELSANDAWFVYLSGRIVEGTGLAFKVVSPIMEQTVKPWLVRVGLVPEITSKCRPKGIDTKINVYTIRFHIPPRWLEIFISIMGIKRDIEPNLYKDQTGRDYKSEVYHVFSYWLIKPIVNSPGVVQKDVPVGELLKEFMIQVYSKPEAKKWLDTFNALREY